MNPLRLVPIACVLMTLIFAGCSRVEPEASTRTEPQTPDLAPEAPASETADQVQGTESMTEDASRTDSAAAESPKASKQTAPESAVTEAEGSSEVILAMPTNAIRDPSPAKEAMSAAEKIEPPAEKATETPETADGDAVAKFASDDEKIEMTGQPLTDAEMEEEYVPDPEIMAELEAQKRLMRKIADTYGPPPGARSLGKLPDLWIDPVAKRVYIDGYVSMRRGALEMFACSIGTKEHESVVALFAKSSEVHAALLAIGAESGTTARWDPDFAPPTGQPIEVWVMWRPRQASGDGDVTNRDPAKQTPDARANGFVPSDEFKVADARTWVRNMETKEELSERWVFSGSGFWKDPADGVEYYSADGGDMICVSNFSTAMMDVPFASSADAGNQLFEPFAERIPEAGTPVRVVLVPQPMVEDAPEKTGDADKENASPEDVTKKTDLPFDESLLPIAQSNPDQDDPAP